MARFGNPEGNSEKQHHSLGDFLTIYFFSLPIIFAGYIFSAYRGRFFIEQISFMVNDGPKELSLIGTHTFLDFQQLLNQVKNPISYSNYPYIDSPFTYLFAKSFNVLSHLIPIPVLYLSLILFVCFVLHGLCLKFLQNRMLTALCMCSILLSIGVISAIDRGNFWLFCLPLLILSFHYGWGTSKGLLFLTIAGCIKPPLMLLAILVLLREKKAFLSFLCCVTFLLVNILSISIICSTFSIQSILREMRYYVNNLGSLNFNRLDQGDLLANQSFYTTNSIATFEEFLQRQSVASGLSNFALMGLSVCFVLILLNVIFLSLHRNCNIEFALFGTCTLLSFFILSAAYSLLMFTPFILALHKGKFNSFTRNGTEPVITWPFLIFLTVAPFSSKFLIDGPEFLAAFFPFLVMFKLTSISISIWRQRESKSTSTTSV